MGGQVVHSSVADGSVVEYSDIVVARSQRVEPRRDRVRRSTTSSAHPILQLVTATQDIMRHRWCVSPSERCPGIGGVRQRSIRGAGPQGHNIRESENACRPSIVGKCWRSQRHRKSASRSEGGPNGPCIDRRRRDRSGYEKVRRNPGKNTLGPSRLWCRHSVFAVFRNAGNGVEFDGYDRHAAGPPVHDDARP